MKTGVDTSFSELSIPGQLGPHCIQLMHFTNSETLNVMTVTIATALHPEDGDMTAEVEMVVTVIGGKSCWLFVRDEEDEEYEGTELKTGEFAQIKRGQRYIIRQISISVTVLLISAKEQPR